MKTFSYLKALIFALVALALMAGCSSPSQPAASTDQAQPKKAAATTTLVMGTASTGSTTHVLGIGMSNMINKLSGNLQTSVEPLGGSDPVLRAVGEGRMDVAFANTLSGRMAYLGLEQFKDKKIPVRLIVQGEGNLRQIIARAGSGIQTPADLKGKTVIGRRKALADVEQVYNATLKAYGLALSDVKIAETADSAEAAEAVGLGTVDAGVIPGNPGASYLRQLTESSNVIFLDLKPKMDAILKEMDPVVYEYVIAAGTYKGIDKPVSGVSIGSMAMFSRPDMPDDVAYTLAKVVFGNPEELVKIHSTGRDWTLDNTLKSFAIPFHNGAIKYFKEVGRWTDAHEKKQQELLK